MSDFPPPLALAHSVAARLSVKTKSPTLVAVFQEGRVIVATCPDPPGTAQEMVDTLYRLLGTDEGAVTRVCDCGDPTCPNNAGPA